jgi:hypothetical protein
MTKKSIVVLVKINASRGNFVMERAGTPFWKFFLSRMQIEMALWNLFSVVFVQPTLPCPTKLCVTMHSGTFIFRKNSTECN